MNGLLSIDNGKSLSLVVYRPRSLASVGSFEWPL